jgi:hypothetical protein
MLKKDLTSSIAHCIIGASNYSRFCIVVAHAPRRRNSYKSLDQNSHNLSHIFAQRGRFTIDLPLARARRFSQMIMILIWAVIMILICAVIMILIRWLRIIIIREFHVEHLIKFHNYYDLQNHHNYRANCADNFHLGLEAEQIRLVIW